jgi:hypothetical protein
MSLGAPDIDREEFLSHPGVIESSRSDGLPSGGIARPPHHVIPSQRAGFLGADTGEQAQLGSPFGSPNDHFKIAICL